MSHHRVREYRWFEGRPERNTEIAAEFIRLKVNVVLTNATAVPTLKQATAKCSGGDDGCVAKSAVAGTSSSRYASPNYWPDPKTGIGYQVQVEIPEHRMNSLEEVKNLPIARRPGRQIDLRNVASVTDGTALGEYDRYNMQRMLTLSANISGEDLGRAAAQVQQAISDAGKPTIG